MHSKCVFISIINVELKLVLFFSNCKNKINYILPRLWLWQLFVRSLNSALFYFRMPSKSFWCFRVCHLECVCFSTLSLASIRLELMFGVCLGVLLIYACGSFILKFDIFEHAVYFAKPPVCLISSVFRILYSN